MPAPNLTYDPASDIIRADRIAMVPLPFRGASDVLPISILFASADGYSVMIAFPLDKVAELAEAAAELQKMAAEPMSASAGPVAAGIPPVAPSVAVSPHQPSHGCG